MNDSIGTDTYFLVLTYAVCQNSKAYFVTQGHLYKSPSVMK